MDRRLTPYSGRVAHVILSGQVNAPLTEGDAGTGHRAGGQSLRQARRRAGPPAASGRGGDGDRPGRGPCLRESAKDGYCGWMDERGPWPGPAPTHWVAAPGTHLYTEPQVQAPEKDALSLGSRLAVIGSWGAWANTPHGFVPLRHLRALGDWATDPVAVAESLLGTPYLWGGNSRFGLDCSGLVQLSMHACGLPCPGDSDMQMSLGRGFWPRTNR